jgi:membrane dipeptidase
VNFYSAFISDDFRKAYAAQTPQRNAAVKAYEAKLKAEGKPATYEMTSGILKEWTAKIPRPPFRELIDHIDHIAKVAGVEHVGLGADWDGVDSLPQGVDSVADLPKITQALLDRGYTAEQIKGILGGNLLRVFRRVEQVSRQLQSQRASDGGSE